MTTLFADLSLTMLFVLFCVGTLAGFVDTLAGGGGMLTLPALLLAGLPNNAALSTNKLQSSFGTLSACWFFIRRGHLSIRPLLLGMIICGLSAFLGSMAVQMLPNAWLSKCIPFLLLLVAAIFIFMPSVGERTQEARFSFPHFVLLAIAPIGFYDGFLGPGTGSFFLLSLIALRGYTLQKASIEAKLYNGVSNLVALLVFAWKGQIVWMVGFIMAAGQLIGARFASKMILNKGNTIIRPMVIMMSILMSLFLLYKNFFN